MALIIFLDFSPMKAYKQFTSKKILIATILGAGLLLSTVFIISPLVSTMAQQQTRRHQQFESNETIMNQYRTLDPFIQSRHTGFGHWKGHHGFIGGLWNSLPFGSAPWTSFGFSINYDNGGIGSW